MEERPKPKELHRGGGPLPGGQHRRALHPPAQGESCAHVLGPLQAFHSAVSCYSLTKDLFMLRHMMQSTTSFEETRLIPNFDCQ